VSHRELEELAQSIPCERCGASAGEHCYTLNGKWAHLHQARTGPIFEAYGMGYEDCDRWERDRKAREDAMAAYRTS
jgi:hypothetical protein